MVYLIYGSPCSGKSTYIKEHMQRGDVVCDVDDIYASISGQDPHSANFHIYNIAIEMWNNLTKIVHDRKGKWNDVYVTSIANTKEKLKEDMERVNADKCIFMNTPIDVCLERANNRPPYFKWIIADWFETKDEVIDLG